MSNAGVDYEEKELQETIQLTDPDAQCRCLKAGVGPSSLATNNLVHIVQGAMQLPIKHAPSLVSRELHQQH